MRPLDHGIWEDGPEPLHFRSAPLLFAAACFALGILADTWLMPHWQTLALRIVATLLLALLCLFSFIHAQRASLFATAALWIALGWTCAGIAPRPAMQPPLASYADGLSRNLTGTLQQLRALPIEQPNNEDGEVDDDPAEATHDPRNSPRMEADLAVDSIEDVSPGASQMHPINGGMRILLTQQQAQNLRCGDRVQLAAQVAPLPRYRDPGAWQYADYLAAQSIFVHGHLRSSASATLLEHARPPLQCRIGALRTWSEDHIARFLRSRINHALPGVLRLNMQDTGTLDAMLLGDRGSLQRNLRTQFERTGSFHLLVVSGLHVALVAACILWLLRRLRVRRGASTFITLFVTAAYALLTGFGAPVQRALWMTAVFLLARFFARRTSPLNALGAAMLAMLMLSPTSLFDAGFQMTVLAVVAIAGIAVPIGEWSVAPYLRAMRRIDLLRLDSAMPPRLAAARVEVRMLAEGLAQHHANPMARVLAWTLRSFFWLVELLLVTLVSELVMSVPMMVYFHRLTPFALPANLLCLPLIAPLMFSAAVFFIAACIHPIIAAAPGAVTAALLHAITHILQGTSHLHAADVRVPAPALWQITLALVVWILCLWCARQFRHARIWLLPLLACTLTIAAWPSRPHLDNSALEMTAIDVGQGDSLFLASPDGGTMLIDAGGPIGVAEHSATATWDVGEEIVSPYLWQRNLRRLDVVVLTHAHSDHMGGMPAVLRNFRPRELWISARPQEPSFLALLATAAEYGVHVRELRAGDAFVWNGLDIAALSPARTYREGALPTNDDSLVLRVAWQKASVLLEGDAEKPSEQAMLNAHASLASELLKVGHHGSRTSSTQAFIDAVHPGYAIISDGRGNRFGHPRPEVLERLGLDHTKAFRTDTLGATTFLLHADGSVHVAAAAGSD